LAKIDEGAIPESVGFGDGGSFNTAAYDDAVGVDGSDTEGDSGGDDSGFDLGGDLGGGGMGDLGDDDFDLGDDTGGDEETIEDGQRRRGRVLGEDDVVSLRDTTDDDDETAKLTDSGPIKPDARAKKEKYNSDRRRRSGPAALHQPDFLRSTSMRDPQDDPFGDVLSKPFAGALDKPFKNPFGEGKATRNDVITSTLRGYMASPRADYEARPRITSEMQAIFDKLGEVFGGGVDSTSGILSENNRLEKLLGEEFEDQTDLNENNVRFFNDIIGDDD
jgi:hypothetical protein